MITLEQAKAQLRVTHDAEDVQIQEMIDAATASILGYIKDHADTLTDTSGTIPTDTSGAPLVAIPADIQMACKLEVAHLFRNREGQSESKIPEQYGYGYPLCAAAIAKLYRYRVPTLA